MSFLSNSACSRCRAWRSMLIAPRGKLVAFASVLEKAAGESAKGLCEYGWTMARFTLAEVHWYEASGIGKREFKIKRLIESY
jgi:hypothetical protein